MQFCVSLNISHQPAGNSHLWDLVSLTITDLRHWILELPKFPALHSTTGPLVPHRHSLCRFLSEIASTKNLLASAQSYSTLELPRFTSHRIKPCGQAKAGSFGSHDDFQPHSTA